MSALTDDTLPVTPRAMRDEMIVFAAMAVLLGLVPLTGIYPFFVMQALCFALLACAFNLLIGYGGLLSFGHAMFLGTAGYCTAHALKVWGVSPELGILVGIAGAAALSVVTGFIWLFADLGLSQATVQRESITQGEISALFCLNVIVSIALTLITAALAPVLAGELGIRVM